jgi:hypothetical protein
MAIAKLKDANEGGPIGEVKASRNPFHELLVPQPVPEGGAVFLRVRA